MPGGGAVGCSSGLPGLGGALRRRRDPPGACCAMPRVGVGRSAVLCCADAPGCCNAECCCGRCAWGRPAIAQAGRLMRGEAIAEEARGGLRARAPVRCAAALFRVRCACWGLVC